MNLLFLICVTDQLSVYGSSVDSYTCKIYNQFTF